VIGRALRNLRGFIIPTPFLSTSYSAFLHNRRTCMGTKHFHKKFYKAAPANE
jgi:hypothetical protein